MQKGKFNWVGDGQVGSTGKGLINSYLAWKNKPDIISCTNSANAGHTAILPDGTKFVAKAIPSSAILNGRDIDGSGPYQPMVVIGAGASFTIEQILKEYEECNKPELVIHERAGVITQEHKDAENSLSGGTKHIASTMQGCGAFAASKIMRGPNVSLARNYPELKQFIDLGRYAGTKYSDGYLPLLLIEALKDGNTILHEGSQGFSLDINHGIDYPHCTSRSCTLGQSMTDMGIPHQLVGDVYLVIRPYPIRVGNVVEDGVTVGHSGGCYPDNEETTWAAVAEAAGAPVEVTAGEFTTVTKRLRRVFTWSDTEFARAIAVNGATKICLNFANYIDWSCYGKNNWDDLSVKIKDWIARLEDKHNVEVVLVGTGPRVDNVCSKY